MIVAISHMAFLGAVPVVSVDVVVGVVVGVDVGVVVVDMGRSLTAPFKMGRSPLTI
jgi:hypothetical protein